MLYGPSQLQASLDTSSTMTVRVGFCAARPSQKSVHVCIAALRRLVTILVWASCGAASVSGPAYGDDVSLDSIRSSYLASLAAIHSYHAEYELDVTFTDESLVKLVGGKEQRLQLLWAADGERRVIRKECYEGPPGAVGRIAFHSFDGDNMWRVVGPNPATTPVFKHSVAGRDDDPFRMYYGPEQFLGRLINYQNHPIEFESVPSLLQRTGAAVTGSEVVSGCECWKVDLGDTHDPAYGITVAVAAWFDPGVGFLPRQIGYWRYSPSTEPRSALRLDSGHHSFERTIDFANRQGPTAGFRQKWSR